MAKKTAKKEDVKVIEMKKQAPKQVQVKCLTPFYDVVAGYTRMVGDEWDVSPERLVALRDAEEAQNVTLIEVL